MKINVGSKNEVKLATVKEIAAEYPLFAGAEVNSVEVPLEEFGHPKTMEATVRGAMERAKVSFKDCNYSFGIESGMMPVPHTKTGYMEFTVCAIYDGEKFHLGFSPAFEWPRKVAELILAGLDGSQAFKKAGLTDHPKIGRAEGAIWHLSHNRMDRKTYTKLAVAMAMIQLENPEHF